MGKRQRSVLGQNFLADGGARQRIAAALGEAGRGDVVEIGPGKAAITELLAERAQRLIGGPSAGGGAAYPFQRNSIGRDR